MNEDVAARRNAIQRFIAEGQSSAREALERYVANRRTTFSLFERLDPHSQQTRDAKGLLEKAVRDRDAYFALITPREPQPDSDV